MPRRSRLLTRILSGTADRNIRFTEMCAMLRALGIRERVRGSHHIFAREDMEEILNLRPRADGLAKPYQVRQVREVIVKYKLAASTAE